MSILKIFLISITSLVSLLTLSSIIFYYHYKFTHTHTIETYKPYPFNVEEKVFERGFDFSIPYGTLGIEWYTYDNEEIDRSPYKLAFSLYNISKGSDNFKSGTNNTELKIDFEYVEIDKIIISSSLGKKYSVLEHYTPPTPLNPNIYGNRDYKFPLILNSTNYTKYLEPAFSFDFEDNEVISTRIYLKVKPFNAPAIEKILDIEWRPKSYEYIMFPT